MPTIKEKLRIGKDVVAGYVNIIPSPVVTQALAAAGADYVIIDQEHGPVGPENLHAMIASTAGTGCSPWVRVPRRDEAFVKPALDAGAEGIVFPLTGSAEAAAECVALTRYPPKGRFLVASGEKSDTISVYSLDQNSGALTFVQKVPAGKGSNWVEIVSFD